MTTSHANGTENPKTTFQKVPRRPHGIKYNNHKLPPTVPILGLGCSSFSTFFLPQQHPNDDGTNNDTVDNSTKKWHRPITTATVQKLDPVVQGWIETIRHAVVIRGVTLLDTAPWYGHGISETVIGYALEDLLEENNNNNNINGPADVIEHHHHQKAEASTAAATNTPRIKRSSLVINTKVGRYESDPSSQFDFSYSKTISSTLLSIQRMRCQYIDVLQLHDPEYAPSLTLLIEETIPAMVHLRDDLGVVKALGITGYPLEVQHLILSTVDGNGGAEDGKVVFDQALTYGHFNLHDTSLFVEPLVVSAAPPPTNTTGTTNTATKDQIHPFPSPSFVEYCHAHSLPVANAAPLSMGLLRQNTPPPEWHPASPALRNACRAAANVASDAGVDLASLATLFALAHPDVPYTLLGMASVEEVDRACDIAVRFVGVVSGDGSENGKGEKGGEMEVETKEEINDGMERERRKRELEAVMDPLLRAVLTQEEYEVFETLRNGLKGPFAEVWRSGTYRWDGLEEARKFWECVVGNDSALLQDLPMQSIRIGR